MSKDEELGLRIRNVLGQASGIIEKKMFGGVGFLLRGNMFCGINKGRLIVRVGPGQDKVALAQPYARPFDMTGKPMAGWVMVEAPGFETVEALQEWLKQALAFNETLPAK